MECLIELTEFKIFFFFLLIQQVKDGKNKIDSIFQGSVLSEYTHVCVFLCIDIFKF